jgi:hypothetical protein
VRDEARRTLSGLKNMGGRGLTPKRQQSSVTMRYHLNDENASEFTSYGGSQENIQGGHADFVLFGLLCRRYSMRTIEMASIVHKALNAIDLTF